MQIINPNTGQTINVLKPSALFDGDKIDGSEPYFQRGAAILLLVISFLWSIIGLNGGFPNTFPSVDRFSTGISGGYLTTGDLLWSGHRIHIHILALLGGLALQSFCTYVQWVYRNRKEHKMYFIALALDVGPSFWATWTLLGPTIMLFVASLLGLFVWSWLAWTVGLVVGVILTFTPNFFTAALPENILVD